MNLGNKFILVLLSMIIFIVSLLTYLNIKEDRHILNTELDKRIVLMKKQLISNAKSTIHYHKDEIENDLASMNLSHIAKLLKQLVQRKDFEGASLVNIDKSMQLFEGRPYHRSVDKLSIEEDENNLIISTPIILSDHWGSLSVVYSKNSLNEEVESAKLTISNKIRGNIVNAMALGFMIFILFSILGFFWARRIVSPILLLTQTAQKMTQGDIESNVSLLHSDRKDEVGILTNTFQEMSSKLAKSYSELRELNESLEERIQRRTEDLEATKDELKILASTDSMTKLYNRRYFSEISEEIFKMGKREHTPVSLIMIDIDNFKKINDIYGHHVGDKVIITIANILIENTRKSDIVCRFGGEEYIILLPSSEIESTMKIAESIRDLVAKLVIKLENNTLLHVTVSIGVSEVNMTVDTGIEVAINKSDNALYEAKRGGKNKVIYYQDK